MAEDDENSYWCLYCGRMLLAEFQDDDERVFVHDEVYHPPNETYTEEDSPQ